MSTKDDGAASGSSKWNRRPLFVEWLVVTALIMAGLIFGREFIIPLVLSVFVWSLINVVKNKFALIRIAGKGLPQPICLALSILLILISNLVVYTIISKQVPALTEALPRYQEKLGTLVANATQAIPGNQTIDFKELLGAIDVWSLIPWVGVQVGDLASGLFLVLIYVAFLLAEQGFFKRKLDALFQGSGDRPRELLDSIVKRLNTYLYIKTVVSLITAALSYIVLAWQGVDFASFWALLVFLLNFIPTVGSMMAVVFPSLLALVQFDTLPPILIVVGFLSAIQFVIGNFVEPAMTGRSLNMSPFGLIVALTFWGMIWGIVGMFLAVPITVCVAIVFSNFHQLRWVTILISQDSSQVSEPSTQ